MSASDMRLSSSCENLDMVSERTLNAVMVLVSCRVHLLASHNAVLGDDNPVWMPELRQEAIVGADRALLTANHNHALGRPAKGHARKRRG